MKLYIENFVSFVKFFLIVTMSMLMISKAISREIITFEKSGCGSILKQQAREVKFPLKNGDKNLISFMKNKLEQLGGVGLAASQLAENKNIIAIFIPEEAGLLRSGVIPCAMHVLVNATYAGIKESGISHDFEGCYSVASKAGKVPRFNKIRLSYQDENGYKYSKIETGFYARVLQHEIDHVNGILIIDRLTPDCEQGTVEEMMTLRRNSLTDEQKIKFDEIMKKKLKK